MRETVEFRIPEDAARRVLEPTDGITIGGSVRKVEFNSTDPRLSLIRDAEADYRRRGRAFFTSWNVTRKYGKQELDSATLLLLSINRVFEPAGEECGTRYDDSQACPVCGAGGQQIGDLRLDVRRLPKGVDFARSIAEEWIVSQRLAALAIDQELTGVEFGRVLDRRGPVESFELGSVPAGRRLIELSRHHGLTADSPEYWVWLNRAENAALFEAARIEAESIERATPRLIKPSPVWHQLRVVSPAIDVALPTRFGTDLFDDDPLDTHRCPLGHVAGLNRLSEVYIRLEDLPEVDFAVTQQFLGERRGLLRPTPLLLVSQRVRSLLVDAGLKGYSLEVVRLVEG